MTQWHFGSVAEAELLSGMAQRAAHDRRMRGASIQNAAKASEAHEAPPSNTYRDPVEFPAMCYFNAAGYVSFDNKLDHAEAKRRNEFHEAYVLPHPCRREGYVKTGLREGGVPVGSYVTVSIAEYFARYRAWRRKGLPFFYADASMDKAAIRELTGWKTGLDFWPFDRLGLGPRPSRNKLTN